MFEHLFKPFVDKGLWIHVIFEGEDGIGKTTALRKVAAQLTSINHIITRHPSEQTKRNIKELDMQDPFEICRAILSDCYYDTINNREIIKRSKGGILLQDRHILMSMLAYNIQSLSWWEINQISEYTMRTADWYPCDYTIYLVGINNPFTNKQSENYTPHSNLQQAYGNFTEQQVGANLLLHVDFSEDIDNNFVQNTLHHYLWEKFYARS